MHEHRLHEHHTSTISMAVSATLHCLTGCAIGEVLGLKLELLLVSATLLPQLLPLPLHSYLALDFLRYHS
jgi:hypothetical protein